MRNVVGVWTFAGGFDVEAMVVSESLLGRENELELVAKVEEMFVLVCEVRELSPLAVTVGSGASSIVDREKLKDSMLPKGSRSSLRLRFLRHRIRRAAILVV